MSDSAATDLQELFFQWLSQQVHPGYLSELYFIYEEINSYCLSRKILKSPLFETTDRQVLANVLHTVEGNRFFRITHRHSLKKMSSAIQYYIRFIRENGDKLPQPTSSPKENKRSLHTAQADTAKPEPPYSAPVIQDNTGEDSLSQTSQSQNPDISAGTDMPFTDSGGAPAVSPPVLHEAKEETDRPPEPYSEQRSLREPADPVITADLSEARNYTDTVPVAFAYFGDRKTVGSWRELYVNCLKILYEDYPEVLDSLKGTSTAGDRAASLSMVAPKQIAQDIYVETNYNATALMGRLRRVVNLCNMDFENLQIFFKYRPSYEERSVRREPVKREPVRKTPEKRDSVLKDRAPVPQPGETVTVSLAGIQSFAYTKPVWFFYRGQQLAVSSWNDLYVRCCRLLLQDYPQIMNGLKGQSICEGRRIEIAGEENQGRMVTPRKIGDDLYVETNLSASELMGRLRRLLMLCHTDPGQVEIAYRQRAPKTEYTSPAGHRPGVAKPKYAAAEEENAAPAVSPKTAQKYIAVLRENFPDGLRQNIIHIKKFIAKYEEKFGPIEATKENLLNQLRQIGVVRNDRIVPRQDSGQSGLADEIYEAVSRVFQDGGTCVYLSALMKRFGEKLGEQAGIYNEEALRAMLTERKPAGILFRHGYLFSDTREANVSRNVLNEMQSRHEPVRFERICSDLWYLPPEKIKHELQSIPSIVLVDTHTYFYAPNLPIGEKELESLSRALQAKIDVEGRLSTKEFRNLVDQNCPSAVIDFGDMKDWAVRNCLGYLLGDRFEFNGALISSKEYSVSASDAYRDFCRKHESVTLDQLRAFSEEISQPINWKAVLSVTVRVSEYELRRADSIHFPVEQTDSVLETLCRGDYMVLQEIGLYLQFPSIEVPWNVFVLESYLRQYSERFRLLSAGESGGGVYGVMARRNSPFQTYEQVITDILARSDRWTNDREAMELLVSRGVLARRRYQNFDDVVKQAKLLREKATDIRK